MSDPAQHLLDILSLEVIEKNLFRAGHEDRDGGRLFGGQVLAQALRAAGHTVEDRVPHSLHGYFMRPGDSARPVLYDVERIRDGSSFTTRRVVAIQNGAAIFSMDVSFQVVEQGLSHADAMPNVPLPEELEDDVLRARRDEKNPHIGAWARRERPFETRSVLPLGQSRVGTDRFWNPVWLKFRGTLPANDALLPHCLLAYASDMGMVSTSAMPHMAEIPRADVMMASLDHALWIHRPLAVDDWLLFVKRTTTATGARGMNHADFFNRHGQLVASVYQEGLMRSVAAPAARPVG
ncbi:MAG: acyl-CoA thioesterase II [Gammaproteobacteria bacterium]|nr:acyl-CoA thioesterase II [Gammaproteobacteria bacterium]